jgi:hypothetical protein
MGKVYWTTKDGSQIDVDEMSISHLRNVLKMIIKNNQKIPVSCPHNTDMAATFSEQEIQSLTQKSQYQIDNEENLWK